MNRDFNLIAKTGEMFVDGIVYDFEDHVMEAPFVRVSDIHSWPLANGFEPFEFIDLSGVVFLRTADSGR